MVLEVQKSGDTFLTQRIVVGQEEIELRQHVDQLIKDMMRRIEEQMLRENQRRDAPKVLPINNAVRRGG